MSGLPPAKPDLKATYQATIKTNRGDIVIDLLNSKATCTVNSFVYLASKSYFSNTQCHRLTTSGIFVLQCGDPTGTGSGGPGYEFNDENLAGATYPAAHGGDGQRRARHQRQPVLPGLQEHDPGALVYAVRHDRQRADVSRKWLQAGTDNGTGDGHPKEKVVIESVTIKKT